MVFERECGALQHRVEGRRAGVARLHRERAAAAAGEGSAPVALKRRAMRRVDRAVRVHHDATWDPDPDLPYVAWFRNNAVLEIFGRIREWSRATAAIRFIGPGGVVAFTFDVPDRGRILMFHTHTPLAPLSQRVRFTWFADRRIPRLLASYIVGSWVSQWQGDIDIWETKIYRDKPMLNPADGPSRGVGVGVAVETVSKGFGSLLGYSGWSAP